MTFGVALFLAAAAPTAFGQVIPVLPSIAEDQEARENCLGLLAVLPVMKESSMQVLANSPEIYKAGGNSLAVNAVAELARTGHADALYSLGMFFESGNCFVGKPDMKTAQALYREAAARGSGEAKARVRP